MATVFPHAYQPIVSLDVYSSRVPSVLSRRCCSWCCWCCCYSCSFSLLLSVLNKTNDKPINKSDTFGCRDELSSHLVKSYHHFFKWRTSRIWLDPVYTRGIPFPASSPVVAFLITWRPFLFIFFFFFFAFFETYFNSISLATLQNVWRLSKAAIMVVIYNLLRIMIFWMLQMITISTSTTKRSLSSLLACCHYFSLKICYVTLTTRYAQQSIKASLMRGFR